MNVLLNLGDIINQLFRDNQININSYVGESIAAVILFTLSLLIGWIVYHVF